MVKEIFRHRTYRNFLPEPLPGEVVREMLQAAVRASNTGNMQLYSIVATTSPEILAKLSPLHFDQPAAKAPAIFTFCADVRRFSRWCEVQRARPEYDNFVWFLSSMTDAVLASQNLSLEAEAHGLGICYLGTTLYNAPEISEVLGLPDGVIPVMAVSVGYPAEDVDITPRLPLEAVVHYDVYAEPSQVDIAGLWLDWDARDFTDRRYRGEDNRAFSKKYFDHLVKKGFFRQ